MDVIEYYVTKTVYCAFFGLVTSPAWLLLLVAAPWLKSVSPPAIQGVVLLGALLWSLLMHRWAAAAARNRIGGDGFVASATSATHELRLALAFVPGLGRLFARQGRK